MMMEMDGLCDQNCVLCCNPHPGTSIAEGDPGDQETFEKFCRQILLTSPGGDGDDEDKDQDKKKRIELVLKELASRSRSTSTRHRKRRLSSSDISVCSVCLFLLKKVTDGRELAREVEGRVGELQRRLLGELRELKRRMEWVNVDMRRIAGVVEGSEEEFQERMEAEKLEGVVILREEITKVAVSLDKFNSDLSSKLLIPSSSSRRNLKKGPQRGSSSTFNFRSVGDPQQVKEEVDSSDEFPVEVKEEPGEDDDGDESNPDPMSPSPMEESLGSDPLGEPDSDHSFLDDDNEGRSMSSNKEMDNEDQSEEEDDNSDSDDEEWPAPGTSKVSRKSQRPNPSSTSTRPSISMSAPQRRQPNDLEMSGMSKWRKTVVKHILIKVNLRRKQIDLLAKGNKAKKKSTRLQSDPRLNYLMEYDPDTGYLTVGDIKDLSINDEEGSVSCSRCDYTCSEPFTGNSRGADVKLFWHVLGYHLNAFQCQDCPKSFRNWNHYVSHIQVHKKPEDTTCRVCQKVLCNKPSLRNHLKKYHSQAGEGEDDADVDLSGMSKWRRAVVFRVLARGKNRKQQDQAKSSSKESTKQSVLQSIRDPRTNYTMGYDKDTGYLTIGEIKDLIINDDAESLSCTRCDYSNSESFTGTNKGADVLLFHHVLGHHLNAFNCQVCDKTFKNWGHYKVHIKIHEKPEDTTCSICGKVLCNGISLLKHMKSSHGHTDDLGEVVPDDDPQGMSKWRRAIISRVHARAQKQQSEAGRRLQNKPDLDPRSNYVMGYDPETGYLTVGDIKDLVINDDDESVACSRCDYTNSETLLGASKGAKGADKQLFHHVLGHHLGAFSCRTCSKNFKSWSHYSAHSQMHAKPEQSTCNICNVVLCTKASLRKHVALYHSHSDLGKTEISPKKCKLRLAQCQCSTCGKVFPNGASLRKHETRMHSGTKMDGAGTRSCICPSCGKLYTPAGMEYHKRFSCPGKANQSNLECDICLREERTDGSKAPATRKTYQSEYHLRIHKRHYHGTVKRNGGPKVKSFSCEFCSTRFRFKTDLNRHIRRNDTDATTTTGNGKMTKRCRNGCGESFLRKCLLIQHERTCVKAEHAPNTG